MDAVAKAAGVPADRLRRAVMLAGDLGVAGSGAAVARRRWPRSRATRSSSFVQCSRCSPTRQTMWPRRWG